MTNIDFEKVLGDAENDLTHGVQQIIYTLNSLIDDVKNLKIKTSKPDKDTAQALLEYIATEEGKVKTSMERLFGDEIKKYFKWLDDYCCENAVTIEEALSQIIEDHA